MFLPSVCYVFSSCLCVSACVCWCGSPEKDRRCHGRPGRLHLRRWNRTTSLTCLKMRWCLTLTVQPSHRSEVKWLPPMLLLALTPISSWLLHFIYSSSSFLISTFILHFHLASDCRHPIMNSLSAYSIEVSLYHWLLSLSTLPSSVYANQWFH